MNDYDILIGRCQGVGSRLITTNSLVDLTP